MISADDYRFLSEMLYRESGLSLGAGKDYLLESRLPPVAVTYGYADLTALIAGLRRGAPSTVVKSVCDAMTTGETLFFRDGTPFKVFKEQLLPEAVTHARAAGRPVRIWNAACSTGQEAYSVAMMVEEASASLGTTRVEIVATDYSTPTLARARAGLFNQFEVQRGLPVQLLVKHFTKTDKGFQISEALRRRITFQEHNLLSSMAGHGQFDIIFIRNVLIYFDIATKKDVLERLAKQLRPTGCLLLGGTENTLGVTDRLVRQAGMPAPIYRRAAGEASAVTAAVA